MNKPQWKVQNFIAARRGTKGKLSERDWLEVLAAHNKTCKNCGATENLVIDHIIPLSRGGENKRENIQPLCRACNSSKGNRLPEEWEAARRNRTMTRPTSYRLPDRTKEQIEELAARLDTNEVTVLTMAIRDFYRQEKKTMLTKEEMKAADFARQCELDPNYERGEQAAAGLAWEMPVIDDNNNEDEAGTKAKADEYVEEYRQGRQVLDSYTMSYSDSTAVPYMVDGTPTPSADLDKYESFILVDSGHIGTAQAYRFARFRRKTTD